MELYVVMYKEGTHDSARWVLWYVNWDEDKLVGSLEDAEAALLKEEGNVLPHKIMAVDELYDVRENAPLTLYVHAHEWKMLHEELEKIQKNTGSHSRIHQEGTTGGE